MFMHGEDFLDMSPPPARAFKIVLSKSETSVVSKSCFSKSIDKTESLFHSCFVVVERNYLYPGS